MAFRLNSCCCFSLRTGAIILGWLGLPSAFITFILPIIGYFNMDYLMGQIKPPEGIDPLEWKIRIEIIMGICIVISFINVIGNATLIMGAVRVCIIFIFVRSFLYFISN